MWRAETNMRGLAAIAAILLALAIPAAAQDQADKPEKRPTVARNAAPSPNATINLSASSQYQADLSSKHLKGDVCSCPLTPVPKCRNSVCSPN